MLIFGFYNFNAFIWYMFELKLLSKSYYLKNKIWWFCQSEFWKNFSKHLKWLLVTKNHFVSSDSNLKWACNIIQT